MGNTTAVQNNSTFFAPQLFINNGVKDISFYIDAFNAVQNFCLYNDDGTIHVAELSIHSAIFHVHEVMNPYSHYPEKYNGITALIGLFVPDVDKLMRTAMAAGAAEIEPAKDYEYGYRQGQIRDPFGHLWLIQKKIQRSPD